MERYFATRTGDLEQAADLASETLAKALERRRDFRGISEAQAAAWVWSIARHELAHFWRARSIETAATRRFASEVRESAEDPELLRVESEDAAVEVRVAIGDAVDRLPGDQREVVYLRYVEGLNNAEIAIRIGVSNAAVRARLSRALGGLRSSRVMRERLDRLRP